MQILSHGAEFPIGIVALEWIRRIRDRDQGPEQKNILQKLEFSNQVPKTAGFRDFALFSSARTSRRSKAPLEPVVELTVDLEHDTIVFGVHPQRLRGRILLQRIPF